MQSRFIIVEYGFPHLSDELIRLRPNRLAVLKRTWECVHAFDRENEYAIAPISVPKYGFLASLLAYTVYNPAESLKFEWRSIAPYDSDVLISLIENGLQHDDDLIQQWFDGIEIVELLSAATSWDEMVLAVDAMSGGHEFHEETLNFVARVLPNRA